MRQMKKSSQLRILLSRYASVFVVVAVRNQMIIPNIHKHTHTHTVTEITSNHMRCHCVEVHALHGCIRAVGGQLWNLRSCCCRAFCAIEK